MAEKSTKKRKTILVVEDEPTIRGVLHKKFEDAGYNVVEAEDGRLAVIRAFEEDIDLITLDIIMPKLDGVSVFRALKKNDRTKNIPVCVFTNFEGIETIDASIKTDATVFLEKSPENLKKLVERVKKQLK